MWTLWDQAKLSMQYIGVSTFQGFLEMWTLWGIGQSVVYIEVSTFQCCKLGVNILLCLIAAIYEKLILKAISTPIPAVALRNLLYCHWHKITVHITEVVLYCVMPIGMIQSVLIPD